MARVVVIGAGVGGMAAAARLAAAGHSVTVCEAAGLVGGKLAQHLLEHPTGTYRFDVGPTLLTLPQVFEDLFAATGDPLASVLQLRRLEVISRYRFADGSSVDTVSDLDRQAANFDQNLGAGTGAAWARVVERGRAIWAAVEQPIFTSQLSWRTGIRLLGGVRSLGDVRVIAPGRTLRGLATSMLADPRQQMMLERYATYEGSDPRRTPAVLAVVPYLEHAFGAWYIEGGVHRLAEALGQRLLERGVRVRLDTAVVGLDTAGGRVGAVRLADGSALAADVVVANADARELYGALLTKPVDRPFRRVPPADSLSGFVLLLALRGRTPGLEHHTVSFGSAPYDAEFDAVFGRPGRPVDDPVIYINSPLDATAAPAGHEAWYVLVNAPRHGTDGAAGELDWSREDVARTYADKILDLLGDRGLPVRDRILSCTIRTPLDLQNDTGAPGGSIYGKVLHGPLASFVRPANRSPVHGLFLVGGSTHPGGGLPLVTMSGRIVAEAVGRA